MSSVPSHSSVRWNDLTHPVVAGLISVIVNYGGTFILVFAGTGAIVINDVSGGVIGHAGIALTFPIAAAFAKAAGSFLSVFLVSDTTVLLQAGAALGVGLIAAAWPAWQMGRIDIVNGLANLTLVQTYENPISSFLEVDYSLPVNSESSIYKFEVEFNNVKIEGVVREKEEAKKLHEKAKA